MFLDYNLTSNLIANTLINNELSATDVSCQDATALFNNKIYITRQYRIKDSNELLKKIFMQHSSAVNFIWNYCNDTQMQAVHRHRPWLSYQDLCKLTAGSAQELGIHSQTVQAVCGEYVLRRKQFSKPWLNYRTNKGNRHLPWIPFKSSALTHDGLGTFYLSLGHHNELIKNKEHNNNNKDIQFNINNAHNVYEHGLRIKTWFHRHLPKNGLLKTGSITCNHLGQWFINLTFEINNKKFIKDNNTNKEVEPIAFNHKLNKDNNKFQLNNSINCNKNIIYDAHVKVYKKYQYQQKIQAKLVKSLEQEERNTIQLYAPYKAMSYDPGLNPMLTSVSLSHEHYNYIFNNIFCIENINNFDKIEHHQDNNAKSKKSKIINNKKDNKKLFKQKLSQLIYNNLNKYNLLFNEHLPLRHYRDKEEKIALIQQKINKINSQINKISNNNKDYKENINNKDNDNKKDIKNLNQLNAYTRLLKRVHLKISNQRQDHCHKLSKQMCKDHEIIYVVDTSYQQLIAQSMGKGKKLNKEKENNKYIKQKDITNLFHNSKKIDNLINFYYFIQI